MTLLATMSLRASSPDPAFAPYSGIETRNVFGLKPAPPASVQPPPPLPRVVLAGIITSLLGNDRVLLKEQIAPAASGGTAREIPMILAEGQREGDIEVLRIDPSAGAVHIHNCGTPMTLTFEKDGAQLPPTRPPVTVPPSPPGLPGPTPLMPADARVHGPTN